ncbi:efflux RND transporter permease subunit [Olivibacter sitiensis]|uniref:efflux RND transporter permease subunit n=1 Tax=Olivibacter sitiensis TaxID=376470 RepID=UPI0003FDCA4D|nr:efflux RND transporter permease subunit [Olivibacter sitiensis]
MLKTIINRPVLATVISILLVILGIVGMIQLPITRFPEIAPPSVTVSMTYPGANAETVAQSVLLPVEEAINGVPNMTYMRSTSSNSGTGTINIFFTSGTDPDQAAVNVQTRVSRAASLIPPEVNESGISVTPRQNGVIMTINIFSEDHNYDETFIQAYAQINVNRELSRVPGVAGVGRVGARDYSMRIWLNPDKLALYNLSTQDVRKAIESQNFEIAPGKFGEASKEAFETVLLHRGRFVLPEEYNEIPIRTNDDGSVLYLRDVARIELGSSNISANNKVDGHPGLTLNITQNSGSNAVEIDEGIRKVLERLSQAFPKGMKYEITYSVRDQINESINQVQHTLFEAFILVFIIVFIFLQDLRSTLIPAITIPVSLVGTFFFLQVFGFSINVLTMFALVLAIGIVVDDAIVVVEAVHQKMERTGLSARKATISAMGEITGAILSITMVMAAVFLPVGFMQGPAGIFYQQFAYTLATAILISALNALTLSPALCALLLKNPHKEHEGEYKAKPKRTLIGKYVQGFFTRFNMWFDILTNKYIRSLHFLMNRKTLSMCGLAIVTLLGLFAMNRTPKSFIPTEDDSFLTLTMALPPGASLGRSEELLDKADSILRKRPQIASMTTIAGDNALFATVSPSFGTAYINLKEYGERGNIKNISAIIDTLKQDLAQVNGATFNIFPRPTVQGFGDFSGLEFVLQDRLGGSFATFADVSDNFINELLKHDEIATAFTPFKATFPQYLLEIDYVKAQTLGVNVKEMMTTIANYYGRARIGNFSRFGRLYSIFMQGELQQTISPETFKNIFVKNSRGDMVPVNTLIKLVKKQGPETVTRYNLFNAITINATPAPGYSTGDAMKVVEEVASAQLNNNYSYEWTGMSLEERESGGQTAFIFGLSILFVYFLLAAQYESYILPFAILLSVPVGLVGVFLAVNLAGLQNNIYVQVSLIMLIGLLAKNAILIVEFAVQQRKAGLSIYDSAIEGARLRLRPILMTSLAFVAGLVPLMWTVGPSAIGNHSISIGAAGGMLFGVFLGIFIIPVLYIIFQNIQEKLSAKMNVEEED